MSFNDPIAELLTKIRNAVRAEHYFVDMPISKMRLSIVKILKEKGFISNFLVDEKNKRMRIFLKYMKNRQPVVNSLKRESKLGRRKYIKWDKIPKVRNGIGVAILSTSKGVLDDEHARELKVGGELLCTIW